MTWQRGGLVALLLHRLEDILILIMETPPELAMHQDVPEPEQQAATS